jgi:ferredoxin
MACKWKSKSNIWIKEQNGQIAPYLFTEISEIDNLAISPKYPLFYTLRPSKQNILSLIEEKYPDLRIGVVVKGCDERALIELAKRDQVSMENIEIMGIACTKEEAQECRCQRPYPTNLVVGEKVDGVSGDKDLEDILKKSLEERLAFWKHEFSKCIKCYGCRNACPLCFCKNCKMEEDLWTKTGWLPPEIPMFHSIRFYHLSDRCIECGECEKACPVDIPLLTIFKLLRRDIKGLFDYEAGLDVQQESPLLTTLDEMPMKELISDEV